MAHDPSRPSKIFPINILTAAVFLTLALFIGLGWHFWTSYKDFKATRNRDFRLQELSGVITYLDEVLTMSARMAASTGDPMWEERYRKFEPQLDAAIKEATKLAPEAFMSEAALRTDEANARLVAMENEAFEFLRQGDPKRATAVLSSKEYEKQKAIYAEGIKTITSALRNHADISLRAMRRRVVLAIISVAVALPILMFTWFGVVEVMGRYTTERDQAEQALRESEEKYRDLVENMSEVIFVFDENQVLTYISPAIEPLVGYSPSQIIGGVLSDFVHPDDAPRIKRNSEEALAGHPQTNEYRINTRDGKTRWMHTSSRPIVRNDRIVGVQGVLADITEKKQAEEALRESEIRYRNLSRSLEEKVKEKVAELQQAQTLAAIGQMVSVVAHEVRNPLQNIRLGLDTLQAEVADDEDKREILEGIEYGVSLLNSIVTELLEYSRPVELRYSSLPLREIVTNALKTMTHKLQGITLITELEQEDREISVDRTKITAVLLNLISNSIEAMPDGGNLKICSSFIESEGNPWLRLSVSDNGCGIREENLKRTHEPFFTTKSRGTGLGISICRKIVEAHKGTMTIRSKVNEGTTVEIILPVHPS